MGIEREFFKLAGTYLACQLAVMGGRPIPQPHKSARDFKTLKLPLIGMYDFRSEMQELCKEVLNGRREQV